MNGDNEIIRVENLSKSFGKQKVLDDINFILKKNENLVVLGRSGTGKTVLLKCIVALIKPDSGKVIINGKSIYSLEINELRELRKKIGFVFQNAALYDNFTVYENLEFLIERNLPYTDKLKRQEIIMEALKKVELENAYMKYPGELSGGMRKRAGIARALILNPEIILYDEPTAGLDFFTSMEIYKLINEIRDIQKAASIIVTHDLKCAEINSDRIMFLNKGKIIFEGNYDNFISNMEKIIDNGEKRR